MQNPFSYTFGMKPKEYIVNEQEDIVLENFMYDQPTERAYMITGVRGSGKTVMLSDISESLTRSGGWIICDLNPARDLMNSLAAQLYELPGMKAYFLSAKIDLSIFGFGAEISNGTRIVDIESALEKMLQVIQTRSQKVMVTVDEAASSHEMQIFCLAFQKYIRKRLPIYLIMTGLYNKIHNLKNMKDCTFLQRAPYITLEPLDLSAIALRYSGVFHLEKKQSVRMSMLTRGYAFAFQVLGKLFFDRIARMDQPKSMDGGQEKDKVYGSRADALDDILPLYESELIRYSYRKIWSELSGKDKIFLTAMVKISRGEDVTRQQLMDQTGFGSAMVNRYQGRLKEQGVIFSAQPGVYSLSLPMFENFIQEYYIG